MGARAQRSRRVGAALTLCAALIAACGLSEQGSGGTDVSGDRADGAAALDGSTTQNGDGAIATPGGDGSSSSSSGDGGGGGVDGATITDAGALDAKPDGPMPKPDAGMDAGPTVFSYQCPSNGSTVSSCSMCTGYPIDCVLCGAGGAYQTFCTSQGAACRSSRQPGFDWCSCAYPSAASCIIGVQECYSDGTYNNICITCGENQSDGFNCKAGGKCNDTNRTCN
jgi:hypothetical protein